MSEKNPSIMTLLSPRYEFAYRFHDALLDLPWVAKKYNLIMVPYSPFDEIMPDLSNYDIKGIITALDSDNEDMTPLLASEANVVNLASSRLDGISSVGVCPRYLARLIVRHAAGAGYSSLAFLPTKGMTSVEVNQGALLKEYSVKAGLSYWQESVEERPLGVSLDQWKSEHPKLLNKLKALESRTLVYTFHDWRASTIVDICNELEISMPRQVGVLGRANSLSTQFGAPAISSISLPYLHMAHKAVEIIESGVIDNIHLEHGEVVPRESTIDAMAQRSPFTKLAELIRSYGVEGITVDELAQLAGVSRSSLERNYREVHGESPSTALKRVRMQEIERLLKSTNLTINTIAEMVGFASTRSFFTMFEREHAMSPGNWRLTHMS